MDRESLEAATGHLQLVRHLLRRLLRLPGVVAKPQKAGLNRAILEVGWGTIMRYTAEAAARTGSTVIKVPAAYSSQTCPSCRHVSAANRPERSRFVCLSCGHTGHADQVAAENLLARGLADLGIPEHRPTGGRPVAACGELCASISLKQETRAVRL